jgi:hypothetical protein
MEPKIVDDISLIKGYIHKQDKNLINQMLNGLDIAQDLYSLKNIREPRDLNKMTVDKGIRRLNTEIDTAKGGRKWSRRTLYPRSAMKILKFVPEDLRETFMSDMLDPNAKQVPFHVWVMQQEMAKIASEINDSFYLNERKGEADDFDPLVVYAEGDLVYFQEVVFECKAETTAGQSPLTHAAKWEDADLETLFDGPHAILKKAVAEEGLTFSGTGGSYDEETAYDAFLDVWDPIPEAQKNGRLITFCSLDAAKDLVLDLNRRFGTGVGIGNADLDEGKNFVLKGTGGRNTIKPVTWMGGSKRIITTQWKNAVLGMNQVSDTQKIGKVVDTLHGYRAILKFMIAFQFADLEKLHINDQA